MSSRTKNAAIGRLVLRRLWSTSVWAGPMLEASRGPRSSLPSAIVLGPHMMEYSMTTLAFAMDGDGKPSLARSFLEA